MIFALERGVQEDTEDSKPFLFLFFLLRTTGDRLTTHRPAESGNHRRL